MTAELKERNILRKDCDGHTYSIPESMLNQFTQLVEAVVNSEFMSDDWYDANDELDKEFGSYMKGD